MILFQWKKMKGTRNGTDLAQLNTRAMYTGRENDEQIMTTRNMCVCV